MSDSGRPASGRERPADQRERLPDDSEGGPDDRAGELRKAEVRLAESDFDAMGIEGLVALFREADIREFEELECRGDGAVVRVATERPVPAERLSGLDTVDRWTHVTGSASDHVYLVAFTAPRLPDSIANRFDDLLGNCDPDLGERGATVSLVGTQETISDAIGDYRAVGATPVLRRLEPYDGQDDPLDALTDRQREVIRTAWDLGHYEVPSEASTADVAVELGLDDSTVAEHLQRAERNLLRQHLE